MKKIIRKRVVLVLLLSLCLSLTACGNGNSGDSGNDTGVTPTRIEGMLKEAYDNTDYTSYLGLWDGVVNEGEPEQILIAELNEDGEPRFELYVDGDLVYYGFLQIIRSTKIMSMPATNMTAAAICAGLIPTMRCILNLTLMETLVSLFLKALFPDGQLIRKPVMVSFQTSLVSGIWMEMRMQLAALRSTNKEIGHCLNALTVMTT